MTLLLSSMLLSLVWFAATNAAASLVAWTLGRLMVIRPDRFGAGLLLTVRLLPAVASSVFVLAVFLPAHWRFEPTDTDESFGVVLGALAMTVVWLALAGAWRAGRASLADHRFAALARRAGTLVEGDASRSFVLFVLDGLPGVSLSGIWQPRILIGSEVLAALTPAELDVAISHEIAHKRSRDNLKRLLMFCAPDLFGWTAVARQLEERWEAEAECEADAHAVMGDGRRAVVLASALVKVARLGRVGSLQPVAIAGPAAWTLSSAFHVPTLLEMRVRRLVSGSALPPVATGRLAWPGATLSLGIAAGLWLIGFSYTLHLVTEAMVTNLP